MRKVKASKIITIATGFINGTWDATFQAIADARNNNRPKARKMYPVLVEQFTFNIHNITRGKVTVKPVARLELPRTKAAVVRAAEEWAAAHPGKPFQVTYEGWFNGTNCLPRYNDGDREERIVSFTIPVYTHNGELGAVTQSAAEQASTAVKEALAAQE